MEIKVNLGRRLFDKEEKISDLTKDNIMLSRRLEELGKAYNEL